MLNNTTPYDHEQTTMLNPSISDLLHRTADLWWESETYTLPLGITYTTNDQQQNEALLLRFQDTLIAEMRTPPHSKNELAALQARLMPDIAHLAVSVLGLEAQHVQAITANGFAPAVSAFAQEARRFDPGVSPNDILQASRNAWTMYGLQVLMGLPVRLTPSVFAYSMLYPYTDNFLDDPAITDRDKLSFNERFFRRLSGGHLAPANKHDEKIFALVAMIEGEYDRAAFPHIYESLLAIHAAQEKSVRLLRRNVSPYEVDVLSITLEKGGTSVLADGYLAAGAITPAQASFFFGWGALMQVLDDLQDVAADSQAGLMTIFSKTAHCGRLAGLLARLTRCNTRWPLDAITNRSLHFAFRVMERLDCFDVQGSEPFKDLMRRAAILSFIDAAGRAGKLYTAAYRQELERHMPVHFAFLSNKSAFASRQTSLMGIVEAFAKTADARMFDGGDV